jgi:chloramphenicol-sensitive protein RarD
MSTRHDGKANRISTDRLSESAGRQPDSVSRRLGVMAAIFAFAAWGALPVFWKALGHIPADQLLAQRVVWTAAFTLLIVLASGRFRELLPAIRSPRRACCVVGAALALGGNWFTFISAVNSGHIMQCSLGYYINPLVNILLGYLFLHERFRRLQLVAIVFATAGVINLTITYGQFPWIAIILAGTFGFYGLLRKTARYEAAPGLLLEMCVLLIPAIIYLAVAGQESVRAITTDGGATRWLLCGTGVVTALPLVTFTFAARRIRLATVGFVQYLTPTGMFLLGVVVYREPFSLQHFATFLCIWAGLAIYSWDTLRTSRRRLVAAD